MKPLMLFGNNRTLLAQLRKPALDEPHNRQLTVADHASFLMLYVCGESE